ncbi:hypothetical protein [Paenibacillus thermotolerans]|uniref:hypothetical protein n=1 Tax=Paenibacillus thermotolerans TaxID=3027807 RepID=UPI002368CBCC|nr:MULTISPECIES: hypothetical protein [unclassified Paenibacillus]
MHHIGPEWLRPAFDQRFIEVAKEAGSQMEVEQFRFRQNEIEKLLKDELSQAHLDLLLELEDILNHRCTLEKEWVYFAGLKDGMQLLRRFSNI